MSTFSSDSLKCFVNVTFATLLARRSRDRPPWGGSQVHPPRDGLPGAVDHAVLWAIIGARPSGTARKVAMSIRPARSNQVERTEPLRPQAPARDSFATA